MKIRLNELTKIVTRSKKRIGRGLGSGKGKTATRGTKGQKARGKMPITFTGSLSLYKKLPLRKGLGNPKISLSPKVLSLSQLNSFKAKSVVDINELLKMGVISKKDAKRGVKILGIGEITHSLSIKLPVSQTAKEKILRKGGKIENV